MAFVALLLLGAGGRRARMDGGTATDIVIAGLASINISGIFGLGWFALVVLFYDGWMLAELAICAVLITVLALITAGGFSLRRRGKTIIPVALLAVAALSTAAGYGFLIYLDIHPIDMR